MARRCLTRPCTRAANAPPNTPHPSQPNSAETTTTTATHPTNADVTETPVVIGSHPGSPWLADCLKTIPATRKVRVHRAGGYEIAALRTATRWRARFVFLQDSTQVLHPDFWDIIDNTEPTWLFGGPPMYMAVYQRRHLTTPLEQAPEKMDKLSSIRWEGELQERIHYPTLWPEVNDATGYHQERHGRMNLVLENTYLRKFKGNWGQG